MPEVRSDVKEEKKPEKKKGAFGKIKDAILPDQDEQAAILSSMVRLGVLVWSGGCLLYTSPSPRDRTRSRMPSSA